ncbi:MAG: hypothetical protein AAB331_01885, partial [Planctomycetota bacterium]
GVPVIASRGTSSSTGDATPGIDHEYTNHPTTKGNAISNSFCNTNFNAGPLSGNRKLRKSTSFLSLVVAYTKPASTPIIIYHIIKVLGVGMG